MTAMTIKENLNLARRVNAAWAEVAALESAFGDADPANAAGVYEISEAMARAESAAMNLGDLLLDRVGTVEARRLRIAAEAE